MNYFKIVKEIIKILWEEEWPEYKEDRIFDLLLEEKLIPSCNKNEIKEAWEKMDAPAIEAEPIKHGRCNTCRYMTKDELCTRYDDENGTHSTMPEGYCWLWERRMDGGEND